MKHENPDCPMYFGATPDVLLKARQLRNHETEAEHLLWQRLCNNQILDLHFRRQHPINRFIADFYCVKLKLVIEIDGGIHDLPENREYDLKRTAILNDFGITVLRFSNEQIIYEIDLSIQKIKNIAQQILNEI